MKPLSIILVSVAVVAVGLIIFMYTRNPTVSSTIRDVGTDVQRGARDASNAVKDAAEDAKDKVKDAAK